MPNSVGFNEQFPVIAESDKLYERVRPLIATGTMVLAKGTGQWTRGTAPKYLAKGRGMRVWDVDGNEYIDYNAGIGPLVLGYAYPRVDDAIRRQLDSGITFSLPHALEVEVAELMTQTIPNTEMVRFSKTGCDVTTAAIRLARAFTGKNKVLCCGYHGWHDWYIAVTDRNRGIPQAVQDLSFTFNYNDINSVRESLDHDDDIAAIILEPVTFLEPKDNFLHELRKLCDEKGILLIFDEMWTGFRLATGGAQEFFGVRADLACFSKAMANGMPISALTGRRDVMELVEKDVFIFTTFGGEALSLAATQATILELKEKDVCKTLHQKGQLLKDGYNQIAAELGLGWTRCIGYPTRSMVVLDAEAGNGLEVKALLQQEMIKRGVLWAGFHTIAYTHTDADLEYTLKAYRDALPVVAKAVEAKAVAAALHGEPLEPVFRKTTNFHTKPKV